MYYAFYLCLIIYDLISAFLIYIFSVSDYEWMTNEGVTLQELPVDSANQIISVFLFIIIILALLFSLKTVRIKFISIIQLVITTLLFLFWLWRFYLRFKLYI